MTQPSVSLSLRMVLGLIITAFCLSTFIFLASEGRALNTTEQGTLNADEIHDGEDLKHSLDLRLARQAVYSSSAMNLVKDLGTEKGIKKQIISFTVPTDGLTEYALLMRPSTPPPDKGYPALILCHGYINPKDYVTTEGYLSDMEFYARNGFAVIKPDFRGQGLSYGQGNSNSAYYSIAYNNDVMSLISSLKYTKYIDKSNINMWGHSMGAYIALRASVVSRDVKNTIILSGPVDNLKTQYLTYIPPSDENNPNALRSRQEVFAKYGTPGEDNSFWRAASPTTYINQSATRYQIHTGEQDGIVPPQLSANFNNYLNTLNHSHEYYTYPEGNHGLAAQRNIIWARSLAFMRKSG